jgi:hypothetical protein
MPLDILENKKPKKMICIPIQNALAYRCKFCLAEYSGRVSYSEEVYGTARIVRLNNRVPELDDYDIDDGETHDFIMHSFICDECGEERDRLLDIFEPIVEIDDEEEIINE